MAWTVDDVSRTVKDVGGVPGFEQREPYFSPVMDEFEIHFQKKLGETSSIFVVLRISGHELCVVRDDLMAKYIKAKLEVVRVIAEDLTTNG